MGGRNGIELERGRTYQGAPRVPARVVSFSGGLGSWYAARRVRDEHGTRAMTLLFTDVAQEDEDLYRFVIEGAADVFGVALRDVADLSSRALNLPPVWRRDLKAERLRLLEGLARDAEERVPGLAWVTPGKDVWDVFREERYLGNSRIDPCSRVLKREAAERWVKARYGPEEVVVYLGIDWTEEARHLKTRARWSPYPVESPLREEPLDEDPKGAARALLVASGMGLPRLYRLGFKHNNCGGACVKAGKGQWAHLLGTMPEVYRHHEQQEAELREHLGKDVTILREQRGGVRYRITLAELRARIEREEGQGAATPRAPDPAHPDHAPAQKPPSAHS